MREMLTVPAILAAVFVTLLIAEWRFPLRRRKARFRSRLATNVVMSLMAFLVGTFVVKRAAAYLMGVTRDSDFGLLYLLDAPTFWHVVFGVVLMDMTFYYWHRAFHEIQPLWRLHQAHHIDPDMDVTTSFRFHPGEIFLSAGFRAFQVGLLGITPLTYVVFEGMFQSATMFHHSNLRLPIGVERVLNKLFVTPRMHGIHHSVIRDEVDSNYSTIFRWWDVLNRSLHLNVPQDAVEIGVSGYRLKEDNTVTALLVVPFVRQRPGEKLPSRRYGDDALPEDRSFMLP